MWSKSYKFDKYAKKKKTKEIWSALCITRYTETAILSLKAKLLAIQVMDIWIRRQWNTFW